MPRGRLVETKSYAERLAKAPLSTGANSALFWALPSALAKCETYARGTLLRTAEMHPETARTMIVNPLTGGDLVTFFRTHTPKPEHERRPLALAHRGG